MKIAVVTSLYSPYGRGGAELVAELTVTGARQLGHDVIVITLGKKTDRPVERRDGVIIYRLTPRNLFSFFDLSQKPRWQRLIWHVVDMFSGAAVKKIIDRERPDVVITHNTKGLGYRLPRDIMVLHDVQYAVPSGLLPPTQQHRRHGGLYPLTCRWLIGSPPVVVSPSRWLLDFYTRNGFFPHSEKRVTINPIVIQQPIIPHYPLPITHYRLLFVGQLEPHKGIVWLIDVLEKWSSDFTLTIVGDGSLAESLCQRVANNDRFVILPARDATRLMSESDCLIVPSLVAENAPLVITMAQTVGLPVIATAVGGVPEMVPADCLFPAGDTAALLKLLNNLDTKKTAASRPVMSPAEYVTALLTAGRQTPNSARR